MVRNEVNEKNSHYYGIYSEIEKVIGSDKMKDFYEIVKGQQIVFPMKLYSKEYIVAIAQSGERSINELAKEFGYSERYFRRMDCGKCPETRKATRGNISSMAAN